MIPQDWNELTIGEIAVVTSGGTPSRDEPSYWDGQIPWVRTTEVQNCKIEATDIPIFITESGLQNSSAKMVPAGTVLMALIGQGKTRGQVALLQTNAAINQNCAAIIFNAGHDAEFFYQYLLSKYDRVRKMSNSAGQSNLNGSTVREINVVIPPLTEQRRIAKILSTWDRAIETTEMLTANSQAQKKALMQQLLTGKKRLPGFRGEWRQERICDVSDRVNRRNDGQGLPILMISSTQGFVRQDDKFNRYMAGKSADDYISLRQGEFAYNKGNSKTYEFGCIFPLESYPEALVPHVYVCFAMKTDHDANFYKILFESDYLRPQLKRIVKTGVRNNGLLNITPSEFLETTVPVPPFDEQRAISKTLSAATAVVQRLSFKLEHLRTEKAALMQQLLTGKRRVKLPSAQEEAA